MEETYDLLALVLVTWISLFLIHKAGKDSW